MHNLIHFLSSLLPIIASGFLILVISTNLYLKIRRKFPSSVNCWFCNTWTKVPYDDRNSFDCPTCSQYNGFTKEGDYNKIIPEQHDEFMNKSTCFKNNRSNPSNGLCALCNNNQQLKIFQLAHFVPMVEENYDVEIEHFQEQLEKAYKLCKKCDRVLKSTIEKQNAWIFGNKLKTMCSNSISKVADRIRQETKMSLLTKIGGLMTIILVFTLIFTTLFSIKLFTKYLSMYVPPQHQSTCAKIISYVNTSKNLNLSPYFTKNLKIEAYFLTSCIGLIYQGLRLLSSKTITATSVNQLLCWVILFLISWVRYNKNYSAYVLFVETFSCFYLLTTAFSYEKKETTQKVSGKYMRKFVKNLEYTCTDISADSDRISTETSTNSSDYLNKSTYDVPLNSLNTSFNTAASVLNSSFVSAAKPSFNNYDTDLNKSLNNLHLGFKSPKSCSSVTSFTLKRPKPVLSPPKFQNVSQNVNSWVAGGFWRNTDGIVLPQRTNLSRSSSESSGFGSQLNEPFVPFDRFSLNSEFTRLSPNFFENRKSPNNILMHRIGSSSGIKYFDPNCGQKFENWSDKISSQATQNFRDLSLKLNGHQF